MFYYFCYIILLQVDDYRSDYCDFWDQIGYNVWSTIDKMRLIFTEQLVELFILFYTTELLKLSNNYYPVFVHIHTHILHNIYIHIYTGSSDNHVILLVIPYAISNSRDLHWDEKVVNNFGVFYMSGWKPVSTVCPRNGGHKLWEGTSQLTVIPSRIP